MQQEHAHMHLLEEHLTLTPLLLQYYSHHEPKARQSITQNAFFFVENQLLQVIVLYLFGMQVYGLSFARFSFFTFV